MPDDCIYVMEKSQINIVWMYFFYLWQKQTQWHTTAQKHTFNFEEKFLNKTAFNWHLIEILCLEEQYFRIR